MSVPSNSPQIFLLKSEVEKVFGMPVRTHDAFLSLVDKIESSLSEHVSESTLERVWGYSTRKTKALSLRTLDVLSRFVGTASWEDFCRVVKYASQEESEELTTPSIISENLEQGAVLKLGWLPDRIIRVRHLGKHRFEIIESVNSSLKPGDSFECLMFQKEQPLYLDRFRNAGSGEERRYVVGERNGLTLLEVEK